MAFDRSLPSDPALDRLLGEIHLRIRQGRYPDAEARIAEAKELAPGHPAVLELEGDLAFARRKFRQAETLYRDALYADPTNDKLEEKYATAVVKVHEPEILSRAIPGDDSFWSNRVPRPPFMSAGLSALLPGLGQYYNGDLLKAVIGIVVWLLLFFGQLGTALAALQKVRLGDGNVIGALFSGGNIVLVFIAVALWIAAVTDAYLIAVQTNNDSPMLAKSSRKPASPLPPSPPRAKKP